MMKIVAVKGCTLSRSLAESQGDACTTAQCPKFTVNDGHQRE